MTIHSYDVDFTRGFVCTRGNAEVTFSTYAEAHAFMQEHYGYTLTYHVVKNE